MGSRAISAKPAFESIGELLIAETKLQFATQGQHASGGWKPLKQATLDRKRRKGLRLQILQETGALMDSMTERGDANMVFAPTQTSLVFGSKLPYAKYHQTGTRNMPRRPPLEFTEPTKRAVVKILQRYIVEGAVA